MLCLVCFRMGGNALQVLAWTSCKPGMNKHSRRKPLPLLLPEGEKLDSSAVGASGEMSSPALTISVRSLPLQLPCQPWRGVMALAGAPLTQYSHDAHHRVGLTQFVPPLTSLFCLPRGCSDLKQNKTQLLGSLATEKPSRGSSVHIRTT